MTEVVDFRDEVSNIVSGESGTVDAIYTIDGVQYVDVLINDRMYYKSPYTNWVVVSKNEDQDV